MKKTNLYLLIAFVAQMGLGALTWTRCDSVPEPAGATALLGVEANRITALEITEKPNKAGDPPKTVKLVKKDGVWVVPSAGEYPADKEKVQKVLDKLVALRAKDPIATNAANHNALKVGDREYGRKVTIETGSETKSLVLGDGPGQSVHVRFEGENEVYRASGMSVWSVSASLSSYIDTKYVEIDKDKLNSVTVVNEKGRLTFTKEGDAWLLAELPRGGQLDSEKVKRFVGKVAKLTLKEPVGKEVKPEQGLDHGVQVQLSYTEEGETKTVAYTIGAKKDDSTFYAKADDSDFVVTVSKWSTSDAREKAPSDLLQEAEKQEE